MENKEDNWKWGFEVEEVRVEKGKEWHVTCNKSVKYVQYVDYMQKYC